MSTEWEILLLAQLPASALALLLALFLAIRYFQSRPPKLDLPVATVVNNDWKDALQKATAQVRDMFLV